jgi:hypothetical protein
MGEQIIMLFTDKLLVSLKLKFSADSTLPNRVELLASDFSILCASKRLHPVPA